MTLEFHWLSYHWSIDQWNSHIKKVTPEIKIATSLCECITSIEGVPAKITGLIMTGRTEIERIAIIYESNEKSNNREYRRDDFYRLYSN